LGELHGDAPMPKNGKFHGDDDLSSSTRPGKHTKSELENGPVEIVDFPINNSDFP
jgi:hypothetical protein